MLNWAGIFVSRHFMKSLSRGSFKRCKCTVIDGKSLAEEILDEVKRRVANLKRRPPKLVAVVAGNDPSTKSYIKIKLKACKTVGIKSQLIELKEGTQNDDLERVIDDLNVDPEVDGILVQLPLFKNLSEDMVQNCIRPDKDVDGFTSNSLGDLCLNHSTFLPCTAQSVHFIVTSTGVETAGKHAVVIGRSKHVGLPIALTLHSSSRATSCPGLNMTTTICHRHTTKELLTHLCRSSDFIISAAGVPGLVTGDMVKPGAVVVDVGITRIFNESTQKYKLVGDVDFEGVAEKARWLTPVPGGVGPLTVAMLMKNTLLAAERGT